MQHAGLDDALLGTRLARLLAANSPLPAREMVARGLAPLAGDEAWLALYQLWVRGGPTLAEHASRTAGELPPAAVMAALADPHLPAVVLDFMARRRIRSPETLRLIVHHPRVHDATLAALARCAPEQVCGAIAKNQRRWLACPAIAEHLVQIPCCDRATAHAVLELGAREAIAGLGELRRRALAGQGLQDDPATHARATAWMLRSGPADTFTGFAAHLSFRPAGSREHSEAARAPSSTDLALRASAALRPVSNLSLRPDLPDQGPSLPGHAPPLARDDLLSDYFSEYALIRYRVMVEAEYLKALATIPLPQLKGLPENTFEILDRLTAEFDEKSAQRIKEIEKTTNHDDKAVEYYIKEYIDDHNLGDVREFVHFGLTSQDINNLHFR